VATDPTYYVPARKLGRLRKDVTRAAYGNALLCTSWGVLYMYYGDFLQSLGLLVAVGVSLAFVQSVKVSSKNQIDLFTLLLIGVSVLVIGLVLPLGPPLLSYFLPLTYVLVSLSNSKYLIFKVLGASLSYIFLKWMLGWDELLSIETPVRHTLALSTLIVSIISWISVDRVRRRMASNMLHLRASTREIDAQKSVIAGQQAKLIATNRSLQQITSRLAHQAKTEKKLTQDLLERTEDQQSMVHAIHNDLKEPLRNIISFTQLIERKISDIPDASKAMEYLAFAKDGGTRMKAMLDDLIRYTEDVEEEKVIVDLNTLILKLKVDLADALHRSSGVVEAAELPVVLGFPTKMRQLFQNLISNSLKFSKIDLPPIIKIYAEHSGYGTITIKIEDNGIGIPESQLDTVFKLFSRANNSSEVVGSGVGLSLCKKICLQHGAEITIESKLGQGSCFTIKGLELARPASKSLCPSKIAQDASQ